MARSALKRKSSTQLLMGLTNNRYEIVYMGTYASVGIPRKIIDNLIVKMDSEAIAFNINNMQLSDDCYYMISRILVPMKGGNKVTVKVYNLLQLMSVKDEHFVYSSYIDFFIS